MSNMNNTTNKQHYLNLDIEETIKDCRAFLDLADGLNTPEHPDEALQRLYEIRDYLNKQLPPCDPQAGILKKLCKVIARNKRPPAPG